MSRPLLAAVAAGLAGLATLTPVPAQDGKKTEIEGAWELTAFEQDGAAVKSQPDTRLVVTGDKFVIKVGDKVIAGGTSVLDPGKRPKTIDATYTDGRDKGKAFKGIYQLDGDTLTFSRAGAPDRPRPTTFKTTAEGGGMVSVYRRAKQ